MTIVIKIIGISFILLAIAYLVKPDAIKKTMEFFKQGKRLYLVGLIRLTLAVVFLIAARECDVTWLIVAFGVLFLISALLVFILGPQKLKSWIDWWLKQPVLLLRILALIILAIGAVIIYSA